MIFKVGFAGKSVGFFECSDRDTEYVIAVGRCFKISFAIIFCLCAARFFILDRQFGKPLVVSPLCENRWA